MERADLERTIGAFSKTCKKQLSCKFLFPFQARTQSSWTGIPARSTTMRWCDISRKWPKNTSRNSGNSFQNSTRTTTIPWIWTRWERKRSFEKRPFGIRRNRDLLFEASESAHMIIQECITNRKRHNVFRVRRTINSRTEKSDVDFADDGRNVRHHWPWVQPPWDQGSHAWSGSGWLQHDRLFRVPQCGQHAEEEIRFVFSRVSNIFWCIFQRLFLVFRAVRDSQPFGLEAEEKCFKDVFCSVKFSAVFKELFF